MKRQLILSVILKLSVMVCFLNDCQLSILPGEVPFSTFLFIPIYSAHIYLLQHLSIYISIHLKLHLPIPLV